MTWPNFEDADAQQAATRLAATYFEVELPEDELEDEPEPEPEHTDRIQDDMQWDT